ncbi:YbaK/EbsC family protein [Timonella senegalensis]|uniref:YbaK/EbsC family protein n=1 Tax=Timonella senegalensis TaxID=1465825 RepID=UPI0002DF75FC|nr:YbaK/EbsC family protein [Timonella senegalensis]
MTTQTSLNLGTVPWEPALGRPDLLGERVLSQLTVWSQNDPERTARIFVCEIDPQDSDTAAMSQRYEIPMHDSVNCVLVAGKREGTERTAAVAVRADTRADINGAIKRMLDVRKASFVPMDRAVEESGMEYGGITPIGLPDTWRFVMDAAAASDEWIVIGSGVRASKIAVRGSDLAHLTGADIIEGLGR